MATAVISAIAHPALAADRGDVVEGALRGVVVVETADGMGSGFAFGPEGELLTNAHAVGDATTVEVVDADDRRYDAEVVAVDAEADVARLRIDDALPPLRAAPAPARPGEDVIAIGAPNGLDGTVTKGIVSAVDRDVDGFQLIQTDVAVNPGNSGGPLLDADGDVIGIVSAKLADQEGIAFAVDIESARAAVGAERAAGGALAGESEGTSWGYGALVAVIAALGGLVALLRRRLRGSSPGPVAHPPVEEPLLIVRRRPRETVDVEIRTKRGTEDRWT